jgi:hypothetical protein
MNGISGLCLEIELFRFLALSCISRYIIAAKLAAALRRGDGAIISIKAAGVARSIDTDDIELKKSQTTSFFGIPIPPLTISDAEQTR